MAEPFGIVAGAMSIAAIFTSCVDCFERIQFGRHFGRDFQTKQLMLNCVRLRLTRWGESVQIYDDVPKLGSQHASPANIQFVKDALLQILVLFADSESISKKYKLTAKPGEDLSAYSTGDMDPQMMVLHNKTEALAIQRQKKGRFLKRAGWALYHRSALTDLLDQIVPLIDNMESLFPAPQVQDTLVQQEAAEIGDRQSLELIEEATAGVDSLLQRTVKEIIAGHQYPDIMFGGTFGGKFLAGDAYGSDWKGGPSGSSHKYGNVKVDGSGKVLLGNKYGGKDFFDD